MADQLVQGTTWRRQVLIIDGAGAPYDPTDLVAVMCPETPITIEPQGVGNYYVTLDPTQTAALTPGPLHWEMIGRANSDVVSLVRENVLVLATCAREPLP